MHCAARDTTAKEEYLSRAEVAELFDVAPSTVTRWADVGKLVCVRTLGGHRRYQKASVVKLVYQLPKEASVETIPFHTPKLYGDHHATAVHLALAQAPGVQAVRTSAALHQVWVTFDPSATQAEAIAARLTAAGYPPALEAVFVAPPHQQDPAWAKTDLRQTQTVQ